MALAQSIAPHDGATLSPVDDPRAVEIVEATVACVARYGFAKTSLDDVAREAGVSRATVYRLFPGGKDVLLAAAVGHEVAGFQARLHEVLAGQDELAPMLRAVVADGVAKLRGHEALQRILADESHLVVPFLFLDRSDEVVGVSGSILAGHLVRAGVRADDALDLACFVIRTVLAHALAADHRGDLDTAAGATAFADRFLLPVALALTGDPT